MPKCKIEKTNQYSTKPNDSDFKSRLVAVDLETMTEHKLASTLDL